ncbi:MAG TPA: aldehyde dehydrogenase family protein [Verrucomicrobiae bacterium]|nr:aldehyde dehydrogenase family protein [Verrucomicrobiae bacterium]
MTTAKTFGNLIDGEWVPSKSGRTFTDHNPSDTRQIVATFPDSGAEDIASAVEAAARAFRSWRLVPAPKRGEIVFRMGEILARRKEELARAMALEMGKPLSEARGDVQEGIDVCFHIGGEGRRLHGFTTPSELPDKTCYTTRQPVGVCGLIAPWNFPLAIPSWKLIPALVCGNTVVLKPSSDAPLLAWHLASIAVEAGVPRGVVNVVTGTGAAAGEAITRHPGVTLVSFTGSSETGRRVAIACAEGHKRVSLEMGGKNALLVCDDADLDLAVDGALWGAFGTAGQRCTATSRVIVDGAVHDEFVRRLVDRARALRAGDPLDERNDLGPLVSEAQRRKVEQYVAIGRDEGARLACGGTRLEEGALQHGFFFAPTVFTGVTPSMRIAREEIFGPVVSVLACAGFDEAIRMANDTVYGLSSAVYTRDVNRAFRAARDLEAGITYINSSTIGAETHLPFGGTKQTGNGHREGSAATAIEIFTEWKTVYVDHSGRLQKAQIDNNGPDRGASAPRRGDAAS